MKAQVFHECNMTSEVIESQIESLLFLKNHFFLRMKYNSKGHSKSISYLVS